MLCINSLLFLEKNLVKIWIVYTDFGEYVQENFLYIYSVCFIFH